MPRFVWALVVLLAAACGAQAQTGTELTPLWRRDIQHLAADRAAVRACLSLDEPSYERCLGVVQAGCGIDPEMASNAAIRMCHWRAIAAWEDVMDEVLERVRLADGAAAAEIDPAQEAWMASMLADVGLVAAPYEGGSMQGPVMAAERARAVAARTIWLERLARTLEAG